jgi:hypothetical protein
LSERISLQDAVDRLIGTIPAPVPLTTFLDRPAIEHSAETGYIQVIIPILVAW